MCPRSGRVNVVKSLRPGRDGVKAMEISVNFILIHYIPQFRRNVLELLPHSPTDRTSGNNSVILDVMADMAHAQHNEAASDDGKGKGECDAATGKRKVCVKKYETECRTRYVKQMMMEDQPR